MYNQKPVIMTAQSKLDVSPYFLRSYRKSPYQNATIEQRERNQQNYEKNFPKKFLKPNVDFEAALFKFNGKKLSALMHIYVEQPIQVSQNGFDVKNKKLYVFDDVLKKFWDHFDQLFRDRHDEALNDARKQNIPIVYTTFGKGMKEVFGLALISHNAVGDLELVAKTQEALGGKRFVKKTIARYPETGTYDGGVDVSCSWSILANRAINFMKEYEKFCIENNIPRTDTGALSMKLEHLGRFVGVDVPQKHNGIWDTQLLTKILIKAMKLDGTKILNGTNYQQKQELHYPVKNISEEPSPQIKHEYYSNSFTFLNVPYDDKDIAKSMGARWNPNCKKWYVPAGVEVNQFTKKWSKVN